MFSQENNPKINSKSSNLNQEQFLEAFSLFDKSGSGNIPTKNLGPVMRSLGSNPTEIQLDEIIKEYNFDISGAINSDQFLILAQKYIPKTIDDANEIENLIRKTFNCEGGVVSTSEVRYIMESLGEKGLLDEELQEMINEADPEKKGSISVEDFCKIFKKS